MTSGLKTIVHPVGDLEAAKPVYVALLGQPHTDTALLRGSGWSGRGRTARRSASTPTATSRA